MDRIATGSALAALALGAGLAWAVQALDRERERADYLEARVLALERLAARPAPGAARDADAPPARSAPSDEPAPPRPATPATAARAAALPAAAAAPTPFDPAEARARHLRLQLDPEFRDVMQAQQREMMLRMHPGLAAELGLTPAEAERLFDLMAANVVRDLSAVRTALADSARADSAPASGPVPGLVESRAAHERELAEFLGDARYRALQEYRESQGTRHEVRQLGERLAAFNATPLRPEQERALAQALAREQREHVQALPRTVALGGPTPAPGPADAPAFASSARPAGAPGVPATGIGGGISGPPPVVAAAEMAERQLAQQEDLVRRQLAAAAPHLSAEQLRQFERMLEQRLAGQRAALRMLQEQRGADGR